MVEADRGDSEMLNVQHMLKHGDVDQLRQVWDTYHKRRIWRQVIETSKQQGERRQLQTARDVLAELPPVSAGQALEANARMVDLLTGQRWFVIQDMREAGESWTAVGNALGMSKQAAWEWYKAKIERQEQHVGDLHDAARARAAL